MTKYQVACMIVGVLQKCTGPSVINRISNGVVTITEEQINEAIEVLEENGKLYVTDTGSLVLTEAGKVMSVNEPMRIH